MLQTDPRMLVASDRPAVSPKSRAAYYPNRSTLILFYLFTANTVLPLIDVPVLGLSITAVFFALVALEILFRSDFVKPREQGRWFVLTYGIGLGIFLSVLANGAMGRLEIGLDDFVRLVQGSYWLVVFAVTIVLISHLKLEDVRRVFLIVGVTVVALGGMRLFEAVALARIGPSTARIFTQNTYGVLFSAFTPFAIVLVMRRSPSVWRVATIVGVLALLAANAINGSRSSWITAAIGVAVIAIVMLIARRQKLVSLAGLISIVLVASIALVTVLPPEILEPISFRFAQLQRYEDDKSYATRVLMQQKALTLLEENPLFGVGRGQFRENSVEFDLSGTPYSYRTTKNFNRIASHNSYAQWTAEHGLVGTVPLAILLILLTIGGFRAAIRLTRARELWAVALFAGYVALSIHLWSIDNLNTTSTWFVYGLVAGMIEIERRYRIAEGTSKS